MSDLKEKEQKDNSMEKRRRSHAMVGKRYQRNTGADFI